MDNLWYTHERWKYQDMWIICGDCKEPISLELLTRRCQAGAQRWGSQSPAPTYGHRQATMID